MVANPFMRVVRWLGPAGTLAGAGVAAVAVTAWLLGGRLQLPWQTLAMFAVIGAGLFVVAAVIARGDGARARIHRVLALWSPFAFAYLCYRALRGALPAVVDGGLEHELLALDHALLGGSPAWAWADLASPVITEVLAYAYATMFALPFVIMIGLHVRRRDRELVELAIGLQLAFYVGFVGFLLVPARSPDVAFAFDTQLVGLGFYEHSMAAWRSLQGVTYDAFPSMHTAISALALIASWRLGPQLMPSRPRTLAVIYLPVVVLLQLATMYLRQHYFVDVIAGWAVAGLALAGARGWSWAWRKLVERELAIEHMDRRSLHQHVGKLGKHRDLEAATR